MNRNLYNPLDQIVTMQKLTQEYVQSLFDYKDGNLYWKVNRGRNYIIENKAGTLRPDGYYQIGIDGKINRLHRLIFLYHYGYLPKYIDHINNDQSNNKIENLREVTASQNNMNMKKRKNSISKYKGISWDKQNNKWKSGIKINGKQIYLGRFDNETDAAKAYNKKAIEIFGEFGKLNIIKEE